MQELDDNFGSVLDHLSSLGVSNNTIAVFTSNNWPEQ